MKSLYELFSEAVIDTQWYIQDGHYHASILGINVKSVIDGEGWGHPAIEMVYSEPLQNETLTVGSVVADDRRLTHGRDDELRHTCVDDALELFGLTREDVLKAAGYQYEKVLPRKLLYAFVNLNNADDPLPFLDDTEKKEFGAILENLKKRGIPSDFRYVSKFESYEKGEQYRVVFGSSTSQEIFNVTPSETLTYAQETVLRDFQDQCEGATIEEKEKAVFENAIFVPKAVLNAAQTWLEKEKERAREMGVKITDPYPADGPGKQYTLGTPAYDYAPRFVNGDLIVERIDVFRVDFESRLIDPNGFKMATLPVTLIFESDTEHKITRFDIEIHPEEALDCEGRAIAEDSDLYRELYRIAVSHLAIYGQEYGKVYANTAQLVFNKLPLTHEIMHGQDYVLYVDGNNDIRRDIPPMIGLVNTEDEILDQCKAVLLTQIMNREQFENRFNEALESKDTSLRGDYRPELSRRIHDPLNTTELVCSDGNQIYRLSHLAVESEGNHLQYALDCLRNAQFEATPILTRDEALRIQKGRGR